MASNEELRKDISDMREEIATVNKAFHELSMEKESRKTKFWRLFSICVSIICVISNLLWYINRLNYEKVTETTTETVTYDIDGIEQSADGNAHLDIVGGDKIGNTEN